MTPLIVFQHPERLALLAIAPALILLYLALSARTRSRSRQFGIEGLERVLPKQQAWKRHLAVLLACLSLVSLTCAFAQPSDEVSVPRQRATVCIAIDVSYSMQATDVDPNRIDASKAAGQQFVDMLPNGFNTALVAFSGTSSILVPPTTDRSMVKASIANLQLGPSTAIGEGVYSCLDALKLAPIDPAKPTEPPPAAIVVLSDGFTNIGRPSAEAGAAAKAVKAPVYTIAYGTPGGFVMQNGKKEFVPVDKAELAKLAQVSGGQAFTAGSNSELKAVYQNIASSIGYEKAFKEVTEFYAGIAVAFALLASLAVMSLAARWP